MENSKTSDRSRLINIAVFAAALVASVLVCVIPYFSDGLPGHFVDTVYFLERVEGLRDSIAAHDLFPGIYPRFFGGYGYATPLFYSDIFVIPCALLRLAGFSATQSFKLFVMFLITVNFTVSFFSYRFITKDKIAALFGSVVTVTSVYQIWEITQRVGVGTYIAMIFLPLLAAALWDFFKEEGKRSYLFVMAFSGMLLSHSITVFLSVIICVIIFAVALFIPGLRKKAYTAQKIGRLAIYAVMTVLVMAFYLFPMVEQMMSGKFGYSNPLVNVGDFVAPFKSIFSATATVSEYTGYIGLGYALWLSVGASLLIAFMHRKANVGTVLTVAGVVIAAAVTRVFPWKILNDTFLNNIQFSFRLFPFVVLFVVTGTVLSLGGLEERDRTIFAAVIAVISIGFGIWQNHDVEIEDITKNLTQEFLDGEGTMYVGMGQEWLPVEVDVMQLSEKCVRSGDESFELEKPGYNIYQFSDPEGGHTEYTVPLIYYKGYEAYLREENDEGPVLSVRKGQNGLLTVENKEGLPGEVYILYQKTPVNRISGAISFISVIVLIVFVSVKKKKDQSI